jgi:hypothetical protein
MKMKDEMKVVTTIPHPTDIASERSRFARAAIRRARDLFFAPDPFNPDVPETSDPDDPNFYFVDEKMLTADEIVRANAKGEEILRNIVASTGLKPGAKFCDEEFMQALDAEIKDWMKSETFPWDMRPAGRRLN